MKNIQLKYNKKQSWLEKRLKMSTIKIKVVKKKLSKGIKKSRLIGKKLKKPYNKNQVDQKSRLLKEKVLKLNKGITIIEFI